LNKKRVLVGSPVYQKANILEAFLKSLKRLARETVSIDYMFVDDNCDAKSSQLLIDFEREESSVMVIPGQEPGVYLCNEESHYWDDGLMLKVANYKNTIITYALENDYDYLFFVDSDLVLHPNLIEQLKTANKEIISEIFWSQWHNDSPIEPNVWLFDEYDLVPKRLGEKLTKKEMEIRQSRFLNQLRLPGVYAVGGLGACTLISKTALAAGVNFQPIKNLTIHGEDRFFCIRAIVLGLDLFVDTHYPAYHIYREQDLAGVPDYVQSNDADLAFVRTAKKQDNKITLSMIVKNEEGRYLRQLLSRLHGHIDAAVIIDDGSTDHTINICREILQDIPLHIVRNEQSMFVHEAELRKKQWRETIKLNPDWILNLDADEILEDSFWEHASQLINDQAYDIYCFRLYDMWDESHYRQDEYWQAHRFYRPFLLRYQPDFHYKWNEIPQHCGRFPANLFPFPALQSNFRVQHFGWSTLEDRAAKNGRYRLFDPDAVYGIMEQYDSIMDASPNLVKWEAGEDL